MKVISMGFPVFKLHSGSFDIAYATQAVTQNNKKPDFLFPNKEAYHNRRFDQKK